MRHPRSSLPAGIGLTVALALAGCGGGSDVQDSAAALAGSLAQAAQAAAESAGALGSQLESMTAGLPTEMVDPTAQPTAAVLAPVTRAVDITGWYDGFAITVDEVTAEPGYADDVLMTVSLTYENIGTESDSPPQGEVEADGLSVSSDFDTPDIPSGGKAEGTATFSVLPETPVTLDEAIDQVTLVYGDAGDNRTLLPLAESGKVESTEPKDLALTGNLTQGQIVVDVVGGSLAPSYDSGEKGKALLDVRITLSCAADCNAAGWNTGYEQFSVTGPDGNSVVADQRSGYCCDALYPGTVSDSERNILTFVVALPGTGEYTLTYDNPNITSTGVPPATFTFTA